ncbi:unnamed protein product [Blepharisma stoltei]|uniref:RNA helicase n=1 Tax=Blepharisma stoltei TaxID=1481888 RepID=A0AAU9JZ64_9CILI|nr:unnamed protein product [Blepharisma stoltei]
MDGNKTGKYIPPHKRAQLANASPSDPPVASKFEKFLQNRNEYASIKAESNWGRRDRRNGFLDGEDLKQAEQLFQQEKHEGIDFESYEDMPVEISESSYSMSNFSDCQVHPTLLANVRKMGYENPTPVQKYAIPCLFARRDLMVCAQTGSGKTASYLFPMVAKMLNDGPPEQSMGRGSYPLGLILAPTRELSIQIHEEALKFCYKTGIKVAVVYGGADPRSQSRELERGVDIIVATPGRLIDFINRGKVTLSIVKYVVLDEADRMLDMGFEPQIRTILESTTNPSRETTMCSATFPQPAQDLASQFMKEYIFLSIGKVGSTTENIIQTLYNVEEHDKKVFLHDKLQSLQGLVLIFVEMKRTADYLEDYLIERGYRCGSIHGDKDQPQREKVLRDFKSGKVPILVATDVAARGLDIPNVTNVINFDTPNAIEDYVHRIGRTGRVGKEGLAISFINDKSKPIVKDLYSLLLETKQNIPDWFDEMYQKTVITNRRFDYGRNRPYRHNWNR